MTAEPTRSENVTRWHRLLGGLPPVLAAPAQRHRRRSSAAPSGRGSRSVASYDEDTTTMGVEAARRALAALDGPAPEDLFFATPAPAYLDKTNATAIHGALELPAWAGAYDMVGSVRSSVGALRAAQAVAGDHRSRGRAVRPADRTGRWPRGARQRRRGRRLRLRRPGGDTRWRPSWWPTPAPPPSSSTAGGRRGSPTRRCGRSASAQEVYVPAGGGCGAEALKRAGVVATDVDHLVRGRSARPGRAGVPHRPGAAPGGDGRRPRADARQPRGGPGRACSWPTLLEQAEPGAADRPGGRGRRRRRRAPRTTDALPAARAARRPPDSPRWPTRPSPGGDDLPYARFLTWRGELRPGAAPASRSRTTRRPGHLAVHAVEGRIRGQRLPGLRLPPPAPGPGVPAVPHHRRDGPGPPGRRGRHGSPPSPSTGWPSACPRRWSARWSTSTAAAATGAR